MPFNLLEICLFLMLAFINTSVYVYCKRAPMQGLDKSNLSDLPLDML